MISEEETRCIIDKIAKTLRMIDSENTYLPEFRDEEYILSLETQIEQLEEMI